MVIYCCWVVKSCPTLQSYGLQHSRPPCPSWSPKVCPSSCPLHRIWGTSVMCDAIQPSHPLTSSSPSALSLSQHQGLSQLQWYIHGVKYSTSKGKKFWCVPTWMNFANTMLSVKSQTEEDRCLPTRTVVSYDSVYLKNCQTVLQSCYIILCFLQKWTHKFFWFLPYFELTI